jgi:hypothetical protein
MNAKLPPGLTNSLHSLLVLVGIMFLVSSLSPTRVEGLGEFPAALRASWFLGSLALLSGVLGLHVGVAEASWWRGLYRPCPHPLRRLATGCCLGVGLFLPFLVGFRALSGAPWSGLPGLVSLLLASSYAWAVVGRWTLEALKSEGAGFALRYSSLALAHFLPLPFASPISPVVAALSLWETRLPGLVGIGVWGTLGAVLSWRYLRWRRGSYLEA